MFQFDLDEVKRTLGTYCPDVAGLFSHLAVILMHVRSYPESELMFKRAAGIFKKVHGIESEEVCARECSDPFTMSTCVVAPEFGFA